MTSTPFQIQQTRRILDSYRRHLQAELLPRSGSPETDARALSDAPFVVASTDTAEDPVLNYGNRCALNLCGVSWEQFTRLPGRKTAEAPERAERERFLNEVRERGFIRNYSGIRVTADGRRFRIHEAVVWNLSDESGAYAGQAVRFDRWDWL